jgi:hypothetical protein
MQQPELPSEKLARERPSNKQKANAESAPQARREGRENREEREPEAPPLQPVKVYAYGVARNRLVQSARRLRVPMQIEDEPGQAQVIVTLKNYYRRRPKLIIDAERRGVQIFVLRANTATQMEDFLANLFHLEVADERNQEGEDQPYLTEEDDRLRRRSDFKPTSAMPYRR